MVRPLPMPPDGKVSKRRLAQIRRRDREKIIKMAKRDKEKLAAAEKRKLEVINKLEVVKAPKPEIKEENPNSPRRILKDMQLQRLAKRKKVVSHTENKEYYPDKLKRKVVYKKIRLIPNNELIPIGCVNKRKRGDPKKGVDYEIEIDSVSNKIEPKPPKKKVPNIIREETIEEIIMRIEETDSLTDEDLMEILTCPSPVWWEEPLNPFYFDEEPINKKLQKTNRKRTQASIKQNQTDNHIDKLKINLANHDEKFVAKRSALEGILTSIKDSIDTNNSLNNGVSSRTRNRRPWKDLDVKNPAFGLKRNSKGRFLKKKIGSSPITISDVSEADVLETNPKNTANSNDLEPNKPIHPEIVEKSNSNAIAIEKDCTKTNTTSETNILINNNNTKNLDKHINNNIKENNQNKTEEDRKKDVKVSKELSDSPKALIWTSNTGERKVINFTQDIEISSDGVEIVNESLNSEVPKELPPLKWFPKAVSKENCCESSTITSDASNDQEFDDNNDDILNVSNVNENANIQERGLDENTERNSSLGSSDDIMVSNTENKDMDASNTKLNGELNTAEENDMNNINDSNDIESENDTEDINMSLNCSDKRSNENDTDNFNDSCTNDVVSENDTILTHSEVTESKITKNKSKTICKESEESTNVANKCGLLGVLERAMDYFRKKSKNEGSEAIERDKKCDDYVVVYKIDETYKDTNEPIDEDDKDIDNYNELYDGDTVSGCLEDFYNNINGHREVSYKEDD